MSSETDSDDSSTTASEYYELYLTECRSYDIVNLLVQVIGGFALALRFLSFVHWFAFFITMSPKKFDKKEEKKVEKTEEKKTSSNSNAVIPASSYPNPAPSNPNADIPASSNPNADIPASSNQAPKPRVIRISNLTMTIPADVEEKVAKAISMMTLDEVDLHQELINAQLAEIAFSKMMAKEHKKELEAPTKAERSKQRQQQRRADQKQDLNRQREEVRTITVWINERGFGVLSFTYSFRGKDRFGAIRQALASSNPGKKTQKFIFRRGRVVGQGDVIDADPGTTLRVLNINNGDHLNAERVQNPQASKTAQKPDPPLISLGVQSSADGNVVQDQPVADQPVAEQPDADQQFEADVGEGFALQQNAGDDSEDEADTSSSDEIAEVIESDESA